MKLRTVILTLVAAGLIGCNTFPILTAEDRSPIFEYFSEYPEGAFDLHVASSDRDGAGALLVAFTHQLRNNNSQVMAFETDPDFGSVRRVLRDYDEDAAHPNIIARRRASSASWVAGTQSWVVLGDELHWSRTIQLRAPNPSYWLWGLNTLGGGLDRRRTIAKPSDQPIIYYDSLTTAGKRINGNNFLVVGRRTMIGPDSANFWILGWIIDASDMVTRKKIVIDKSVPIPLPPTPLPLQSTFDSLTVTPTSRGADDGWLVVYKRWPTQDIMGVYVDAAGTSPSTPRILVQNGPTWLPGATICLGRDRDFQDLSVAGAAFSQNESRKRYMLAYTESRCPGSNTGPRDLYIMRFDWQLSGGGPGAGFLGFNFISSRNLGPSSGALRLAYDVKSESNWLLLDATTQDPNTLYARTRVHRLGHNGVVVQKFTTELGFTWPFQHALAFDANNNRFPIVRTRIRPSRGVYGWNLPHSTGAASSALTSDCEGAAIVIADSRGGVSRHPPYAGDEFLTVSLTGGPATTPVSLLVSPERLEGLPCDIVPDMTQPNSFTAGPFTTNLTGTVRAFNLLLSDARGVSGVSRGAFWMPGPVQLELNFPRTLYLQWVWQDPEVTSSWLPGAARGTVDIDLTATSTSNAVMLTVDP
jgi:hypothetical protein